MGLSGSGNGSKRERAERYYTVIATACLCGRGDADPAWDRSHYRAGMGSPAALVR
jgi:hypothetical protein